MNGIIVIDKPKDFTSFDIVAIMRKICHTKKIGHAGTLDPMATGVLPILIGNATKAQSLLPNTNKEYLASFKLGIQTDTQDITGKVLATSSVNISEHDIVNALKKFQGDILQIPPMYSALKHNGQRLYDLARQGIEVERKPRHINISKIELCKFNSDSNEGSFIVSCSTGTYVRTLCEDLGKALKTFAVMTELKRTSACGFDLCDAIPLDQAKNLGDNLCDYLLSVENLFRDYISVSLSPAQSVRFKNGGALYLNRLKFKGNISDNEKIRVYNNESNFLGLGIISFKSNEMKILKNF